MTAPNRTHLARTAAAIIPLILVNGISVLAQYAFWRSHLPTWPAYAAAGFAAALESVAVFVGIHAHLAALSNDSAFRLRVGSYALGAVMGGLNGSHYLNHGRLTAAALGVGLLSASSPWLWGIHSRRQSRDALMAAGLVEAHALRIGATRFMYHPFRSFRVMRAAAWSGTTEIAEAIAAIEPQAQSARVAIEYQPETLADMRTQADRVRFAAGAIGRASNRSIDAIGPQEIAAWLQDHAAEIPDAEIPSASYAADVIRRTIAARDRASGGKITQLRPARGKHA